MSLECAAVRPVSVKADSDFDVVIRCRINLDRNLAGYRFPGALSEAERLELMQRMKPALLAAGMPLLQIREVPLPLRSSLVERELLSRSYAVDEEHFIALHPQKALWAVFMQREHVGLVGQRYGLALKECCEELFALDEAMNRVHPWAFDHDFGYICSDVDRFGTGLGASLVLHLPALELTGFIEMALKQAMDAGFVLGGVYGSGRGPAGALYELSLPTIFAESEDIAIERLKRAAGALTVYERSSRQQLLQANTWEILDLIGRACGRAQMAHSVGWDECTEIISGLRLGLACGVLEGMSLAEASELWYTVRVGKAASGSTVSDHVTRAAALRAVASKLRFSERYRNV
ncbi:MAG: hypothetical protein KKI09_06925 [Spirochaetes bacterium]|nr:hypothetical protein [Spirochaetota bacterium]MBU0955142.1 hypothetical protein [Spirochaetota bacterium]